MTLDLRGWRVPLGITAAAFAAAMMVCGCKGKKGAEQAPAAQATAGGESGSASATGATATAGQPGQPSAGAEAQPADEGSKGTESGASEASSESKSSAGTQSSEQAGQRSGSAQQAANPWGETRAQQCAPPPRKPISATAETAVSQGVEAARKGDDEAAVTAFRQALSSDSGAYTALYNLGVLADRSGKADEALGDYRQALSIQPDYEDAARGIVAIDWRRNDIDGARQFVEALATQYPTNLALQALYAETLTKAGQYDQAWQAARKALECDERYVPAMIALVKASIAQGRTELAQSVLDQALAITDKNAELHYLKGKMLLGEPGRLRDALAELRKAIELRPSYLEARMALGIQLLDGGDYQQALAQFQAAEKLAPELVAVHLNLGDAYRASKQWAQAKSEFDKALQMEPQLPQAHFDLGLMYMTAGDKFPGLDALQALQQAKAELSTYHDMMGPRLPKDDPSETYMGDLDRQIERAKRRMERQAAQKQRESERAARQQPQQGGSGQGGTGASGNATGGGASGGGGQ